MRSLIRWLTILIIPAFVAVGVFKLLSLLFLTGINPLDKTPVFIEVAPGSSFRAVARELETKGVLRNWWTIETLGRLKKGGAVINAGEYELSRAMNPTEILQKLMSGDTFKRKVTIKEGVSIWAIGALLENAGLCSREEFEHAVLDQPLLLRLGIQASSAEGYLFPETYHFSRPITAAQIVERMVKEFERSWTEKAATLAKNFNLSRHELVTLASIVEKESGVIAEQPIISSVIHNRLKAGMKLQMDPTVIYGITNFSGNLTKEDLERPSPYNTYVNYGLPPGPICNPGRSALEAAVAPAITQFLYFVADGKGAHVFSTTLAEHNEAVKTYQLKK